MEKLNVGIVGYGIMGRLYADFLAKNSRTDLVAVTARGASGKEEVREQYGCAVFPEYREMYEAGGLDLVIVTLPDFLHRQQSSRGLHRPVDHQGGIRGHAEFHDPVDLRDFLHLDILPGFLCGLFGVPCQLFAFGTTRAQNLYQH